jgi:hypothetical protein
MTMKWRTTATALAVLGAICISGCESQPKEPPPPRYGNTPLALDPTHDIPVAPWWTSGDDLLHLSTDGTYALYEGMSRYHEPVEEGRWTRGSYVVVWLEPYTTPTPIRQRLTLALDDDRLVLQFPGKGIMLGFDAPPVVVEDLLFDEWLGKGGTLHLHRTMRYSYFPEDDAASHGGDWEVDGETIILSPRTPTIDEWRLDIRRDDDSIRLESADLSFQRDAASDSAEAG